MNNHTLAPVTYILSDYLVEEMHHDRMMKELAHLEKADRLHQPHPKYAIRVPAAAVLSYGPGKTHNADTIKTIEAGYPDEQFLEYVVMTTVQDGKEYSPIKEYNLNRSRIPDQGDKKIDRAATLSANAEFYNKISPSILWWEKEWLCVRLDPKIEDADMELVEQHDSIAHRMTAILQIYLAARSVSKTDVTPRLHSNITTFGVNSLQPLDPDAPRTILLNVGGLVSKHDRGTAQGGTHRSPLPHWRDSHERRQHHGPGNTLLKIVYVDGVMVNEDDEYAGPPITYTLH